MTSARTAIRAAAVLGATAALTVAGAGAASAATASDPVVEGNTISVTFEKDGLADAATCVAAVAPTAEAATFAAKLADLSTLNPGAINDLITGDTVATFLRGGPLNSPIANVDTGDVTVSATVESGVYSAVTYCVPGEPSITPLIVVGSPLDAISGLSSGGGLDTLSSALGGGDATTGALGLSTLSSALDGGQLAGDE
ncbi:hypothetical protein [Dietzia lutea]|uniref:Uncharacterized protein n=1 Tax=Dietzia lutea TaxID=546160 RepID=A0A2S1R557_9ACTN|nr:hypothetical protein [Dietzia lutea]AWH91395.1 hypothetical protein A6035_03515 [Dietzia lutea]